MRNTIAVVCSITSSLQHRNKENYAHDWSRVIWSIMELTSEVWKTISKWVFVLFGMGSNPWLPPKAESLVFFFFRLYFLGYN